MNFTNKIFVLFSILSFLVLTSCKEDKATSMKSSTVIKASDSALPENLPEELKEEDCDDKAEKMKEELPTEINLQGGGDAGCSLDDINGGQHP